jgi:hypothetical protein
MFIQLTDVEDGVKTFISVDSIQSVRPIHPLHKERWPAGNSHLIFRADNGYVIVSEPVKEVMRLINMAE